jgi:hypothetical protein
MASGAHPPGRHDMHGDSIWNMLRTGVPVMRSLAGALSSM